jgi:TRAP-type transport system periplasmic protein
LSDAGKIKHAWLRESRIRGSSMKIKNISLLLVVLFVVFVCFCLPNPVQSQGKPMEFSYSNHHPPEFPMSKTNEEWGKEIEKRTNNRVKFTYYHGGTLTSSPKMYEGAVKGLSDIGHSVFSYTPGRFPLMDVIDLPGYTVYNDHITTRIADEIYRKFQPKELSDVHILYVHAHGIGVYYTAKKPVRTLEDMKGMKIRSAGFAAKMVSHLGGTPVGMPKADEYDSLSRGVVDGTVGTTASLKGWRIAEVCKYSTWAPRAGYVSGMFVAMNKKKWDSLPPDIQKVFTEVSREWVGKTADSWNAIDLDGYEYGKKMGHQYVMVDEKEQLRWDKALQPMYDEYVKSVEAKGLPGKAAFEFRQQLLEKYSKEYKSIFK